MADPYALLRGGFQGVNMALNVDRYLRQRDRAPIEQQQHDLQFDLDQRLKSMQVDEYLDATKRRDARRKLSSGIMALENGDVNNADALDAVNIAFKNDISRGTGGDITGKRVSRILPAPDGKGFMLELEVTKKDGSKYFAPWTRKRSADPNDRVVKIDGGEGLRQLMTTKQIIDRMDEASAQYGDEWLKDRFERAKEQRQHRYKLDEIDAQQRARKKYGTNRVITPSADMQWVDRLVAAGLSEREALEYVAKLKSREGGNIKRLRASLFTNLAKARDKALLQPGDPGYKSDDELWKLTEGMVGGDDSADLSLTGDFPVGPGVGGRGTVLERPPTTGPAAGLSYFGPVVPPGTQAENTPPADSGIVVNPTAQERATWDLREDGTKKGLGYFGVLKRPDGRVSSELSFDFDAGGKKIFAPLIVPTLTRGEIDQLLSGAKPTAAIYRKAQDYAIKRIKEGKSPFAEDGEQQPLPPRTRTPRSLTSPSSTPVVAPSAPTTPAAPPAAAPQAPAAMPPPSAFAGLKEGTKRKFRNGQVWTIRNGQPVRLQ